MEIYLVGGAVRDALLGLEVKDKDWVVVGAEREALLALKYQQVGGDFPVFLHPKTKEEYALARTERKSGQGYTGFICDFTPDVTLEEDLIRRDLTINAMAKSQSGEIIDPYQGQQDLQNKILRHVSPAFIEDPLRVLRVARFAARFHHLGFTIAPETLKLMQDVVHSGELDSLPAERIWMEWEKSLRTDSPQIFLQVLRDCGALALLLPEFDRLFGVPQPEKWHPEIDTGVHTLMVAEQAAKLTQDPVIRFAAQTHDLGKGLTPKLEWPSHKRHCQLGLSPIKAICERFKIPNAYRELALLVCAEHTNIHNAGELRADTFIKIFDRNDCWRKPERVGALALACMADHLGRTGFEKNAYPQADWLKTVFDAASRVDIQEILAQGLKGKEIRNALTRQRILHVEMVLTEIRQS